MKAISNIGLTIGSLLFLAALYLQFMMAPHVAYLEETANAGDFNRDMNEIYMNANDTMHNVAYACLLGGGLAFVLCIIGFIKTKNKMALLGAALSLVALFIGIIQGTHMF